MNSEEGRLGRWSRRKAEARKRRGGAAPVLDKTEHEKGVLQEPDSAALSKIPPDEGLPEGLDLPDIETLTAESDFGAFMKEGVPAALRRLALRKLWSSDPAFNIIDEMVEYGEDYTNAAMVVEGMNSAWQPGRGYADEAEKPATPETGDTGTGKVAHPDEQADGEEKIDGNEEMATPVTELSEDESDEDSELG